MAYILFAGFSQADAMILYANKGNILIHVRVIRIVFSVEKYRSNLPILAMFWKFCPKIKLLYLRLLGGTYHIVNDFVLRS